MRARARIILLLIAALLLPAATDPKSSLTFEGRNRTYIVHIPDKLEEKSTLPLIINLHGFAEGARMHVRVSGMNRLADEEGFMVCYPNGTGFPRAWNAGRRFGSRRRHEVDDVGFISALLDTLIANYPVDTTRIYACGFSNGAMMAHRLGCQLSERIAGIAAVAGGLMVAECRPRDPVPVIAFHALNDRIVEYEGDTVANAVLPGIYGSMLRWADINNCDEGPDTTWIENREAMRQTWSGEHGELVVLWTTKGGKHTWPGGKGVLFPGAARPSTTIDANELMWEFFSRHFR